MEVLTLADFKQNCTLLENSLSNEFTDPTIDLRNLKSWVVWIQNGEGTPDHAEHFFRFTLPKIVKALAKRHLVRFFSS